MEFWDSVDLHDGCMINDEWTTDSDRIERIGTWLESEFRTVTNCPYCSVELQVESHETVVGLSDEREAGAIWDCRNCAYWQVSSIEYFWNAPIVIDHERAYISKLREFDHDLPEGCAPEIAQWIRRHPQAWQTIDPYRLERLTCDILRANHEECEVIHVGRPDDGGVDVLFIDADENQWLVQVKRHANEKDSEGVSTIRNLLGAMVLNRKLHGVVVSTADHFTFRAYEATENAAQVGYTVRLVDRGKLNRMIGAMLPDRTWRHVVESLFPQKLDEYMDRIPPHESLTF